MDQTQQPDEEGGDRPGPESGGCLNLGWGCLPVVAALLLVVPRLFF